MNVRPIQEQDIPGVINLFRENYGDDYSMPEFYDPQWVKRGVYSDHILWLVIEDEGKIVAGGACILNYGDYNDLIGEIGRVVVDPDTAGKGLGRLILESVVDAADERVEFAFAEARTVHPKTQKINDRIGLVPLGFLPLHYKMKWRESVVFAGQLFGNGRVLRRIGQAQVIPAVEPLAKLALKNLELDETVHVVEHARAYPLDQTIEIQPLTATLLMRVLKIEQGRVTEPEVFSGVHLDEGMPQLAARRANYIVAMEGEHPLGALGYNYLELNRSLRITELIAQDDNVKGALLSWISNQAIDEFDAEVLECDVSAYSPRIQQTLYDMGFLPTAYVPGMVFHQTARFDIVKFAKLNVPWDLGPIELTESGQAVYDLVVPAFEQAAKEHESRLRGFDSPLLKDLSPLELYQLNRAGTEAAMSEGSTLDPAALNLILSGAVQDGQRAVGAGTVLGAEAMMGQPSKTGATVTGTTRVFTITRKQMENLCQRHPRLGIKLYQNLTLGE